MPRKTDEEILDEVVAECRRLQRAGFPRVARSTAIRRKVPAGRRRRRNGDWDGWWARLDRALKAPAAPEAEERPWRPTSAPAPREAVILGRSCLPPGDRE